MENKPKILCLNTAWALAQIAYKNGDVFTEKVLDANAKSSENVLPKIEELLIENGVNISNITHYGVVVGPGSFTGLRVAVSLVKGFCAVFSDARVVAVNSLDLMAKEFMKTNTCKDFSVVQNALGGRFFVKNFKNGVGGKSLLVRGFPGGVKVGLESENLPEMDFWVQPTPQTLAQFTQQEITEQNFVSVEKLEPVYLRLSQAEENLLKKEENAED